MKKINELWRTEARRAPLKDKNRFSERSVFPSGRQALSFSLADAGISRAEKVAIPDWSSSCVISAIGKYASPIPMREALKHKIKVRAVLIYEQWGWPVKKTDLEKIAACFPGAVLLHDMVDSAHLLEVEGREVQGFKSVYQIASLSKLLGVSGGGLLKRDGEYLQFGSTKEAERLMKVLENNNLIPLAPYGYYKNILKTSVPALDPYTKKWLKENDLRLALEQERKARLANLQLVLKSDLAKDWPEWMREAVAAGAGPGIIPMFRGRPEKQLRQKHDQLLRAGVETSLYHFNWSGDPVRPKYELCLAFPVHGMVTEINEILERIKDG